MYTLRRLYIRPEGEFFGGLIAPRAQFFSEVFSPVGRIFFWRSAAKSAPSPMRLCHIGGDYVKGTSSNAAVRVHTAEGKSAKRNVWSSSRNRVIDARATASPQRELWHWCHPSTRPVTMTMNIKNTHRNSCTIHILLTHEQLRTSAHNMIPLLDENESLGYM